ncbi:SRPBCC family protein [Planctomicrobium sp. SH668]|uniref:SRPBCC family protein n=1 Tax=Planctomicrobium sp. SH668 TaxID=3448126 RepID=UPI003F5BADAE
MPTVDYEARLNCSPEALFNFLIRPANILKVSDPQVGISFTSAPEVVELGSKVDFQVITFGQVVKTSVEITKFEQNRIVVETQTSGPMKSWEHIYEYIPTPEGVILRDVVDFQLPGGLLGLMLSESKVRDYLEDGFYYREQKLKALIEKGELV